MRTRIALTASRSFAILAILANAASAQFAPGSRRLQRAMREYQQLQAQALAFFKSGETDKAAAAFEALTEKYPDDPLAYYNLACAHALLKKPDLALADLAKAVDNGWSNVDQLQSDADLASIRNDKKFAQLVETAKVNQRAGARYEKPEDIPAVNTAEGFPENGLKYRLRIPKDATPQKPAKLIIWLHGSGNSMDNTVEKLAPDLAAHGFALMVFPQKQYLGWLGNEEDALLAATLPDVAKEHLEIDASRPVLLAFSAGGQMALDLWQKKPDAFSALILDDAYPIEIKNREVLPIQLPHNNAIKKTPILALVSDRPADAKDWDRLENRWLNAGVPLSVKRISDNNHSWLLTGDTLKAALDWLDSVKAGKLPADKPQPRDLDI